MRVVEQFLAAKTGNPDDCEDGIVVTDGFAAVIDGATDKTGRRFGGVTGGRFAMLACADAIRDLKPLCDVAAALPHLSDVLASRIPGDLAPRERPAAVLAVYSRARREVWQIGDVAFWHPGLPRGGVRMRKTVDRYATEVRVAILRTELAAGTDAEVLAEHDPGRDAISSILKYQAVLCNSASAGRWGYPAVDGRSVPAGLVAVHHVPADVTQLVLASDGYPRILPTLTASERALASLLKRDPLCMGPLRGTKAVSPGNVSFDDRAYLSIAC